MRRYIGLLLLLLAALLAGCASGPKVEPSQQVGKYAGGARLAFDQKAFDFGNVPFGREVKATFQLKNVGDQPLVLNKVDVETREGC